MLSTRPNPLGFQLTNKTHMMLLAAFLVASLLFGNICSAAEAPATRPNIIFIMADDLGYGDLSCFGQTHFETPNIDKLAQSGMRLTQHYAGDTVCAPSRCALMTGLHTGHCFIRGNLEHKPIGQSPIPSDAITIAEVLHDSGYATGMFGKWGLGYPGSEGDPMKQGFDEFFGYNCQRQAHSYYPEFLWHNSEKVPLNGHTYSHDLIIEHALDFIRDNRERPFFCYVPVTIPHAAMELPQEAKQPFLEQYPEFDEVVAEYGGSKYNNPIAAFPAMVTRLDGDVGRIVSLIKKLGLRDNTMIVFTSDNGPHHEGGHDPDYFNSSGSLRGIKRDLYEGGIRVPTIVSWPGKIQAGSESDQLSAFWDWLPTLCELAGVKSKVPDIDGISLLPTLFNEPGQKEHKSLYWEFHEQGGKQAIRVGNWKAVRLDVSHDPNGPLELYNLATDPHEENNVADKNPELVQEMAERMSDAHTPSKLFNFGS